VTLSFARRSRDEPAAVAALACGILLAWAVMFGRVLVIVLAVNVGLVYRLLPPFAAMGLMTLLVAWLLYRRGGETAELQDVPLKNPFSLTAAAQFAVAFAVVLLLVKVTQFYFPGGGVYIVAALAGLTDVDAITLSMAEYAKANPPTAAAIAVVIAALSNHCRQVRDGNRPRRAGATPPDAADDGWSHRGGDRWRRRRDVATPVFMMRRLPSSSC
jgi:uncharacterized membrane protein (DUF4010 family)